jgi:hypothetical protein
MLENLKALLRIRRKALQQRMSDAQEKLRVSSKNFLLIYLMIILTTQVGEEHD